MEDLQLQFEDDDEDMGVNAEEAEEEQSILLGDLLTKSWDSHKAKLDHDYAIIGWALSVMPEVYKDARERLTGEHRDVIERVVRKLFTYPYQNRFPDLQGKSEDEIVDLFWDEFKAFCHKTKPFDKAARWNSEGARLGKSWIWHEKYSKPHTKVLGIVGCQVTAQNLGIGPCERNWGGVKGIKTGNRVCISGETTGKRAIIYTSALVNEARLRRDANERIEGKGASSMFSDDDMK